MSFYLRKPRTDQIDALLASQSTADLSYPMHNCTQDRSAHEQSIAGYVRDHNRVKLGQGSDCFKRAQAALRQWQMFNLGWVEIADPTASIEIGTLAGVVAQSFGFWSVNVCRIVYTLNEVNADVDRYGFGYGTLDAHIERGEERFCIEYHHADQSVWYDILAFSQPNKLIAKVGYPVVRHYQKRFACASKRAMKKAIQQRNCSNVDYAD